MAFLSKTFHTLVEVWKSGLFIGMQPSTPVPYLKQVWKVSEWIKMRSVGNFPQLWLLLMNAGQYSAMECSWYTRRRMDVRLESAVRLILIAWSS